MTLNEAVRRQRIAEAKDRVVRLAKWVSTQDRQIGNTLVDLLRQALRELAELEKE